MVQRTGLRDDMQPSLSIGALQLTQPYILAPMAGITDFPFRMLCRRFGAECAFTEMINVRSLGFRSRKTRQMLTSDAADRPLGVQILGCQEQYILRGMDILAGYSFDLLDFNAACPAKKVIRRGEGVALMRQPKKLAQLLKLIIAHAKVPVTVKIRSGWDSALVNAVVVARAAEDAGVQGIFIHGRTRVQEYGGPVQYEVIRRVKKAVAVPVIASGDVFSGALVRKMYEETGADGVLIARGALGNPWIFHQIERYLATATVVSPPAMEEVLEVMRQHLADYCAFYGEKNGVVLFRKFFAWYSKGWRRVRIFRERACRAKTKEQMLQVIDECRIAHRLAGR